MMVERSDIIDYVSVVMGEQARAKLHNNVVRIQYYLDSVWRKEGRFFFQRPVWDKGTILILRFQSM